MPTEGNDWLNGTGGNDTIDGLGGDDRLAGRAGDDSLNGGAGNDWIWGEDGSDTLRGGNGDDTLAGGLGSDLLVGGAGQDAYFLDNNENGHDTIDGFDAKEDYFSGPFFSENDVFTNNIDRDGDGQNDDALLVSEFGVSVTFLNYKPGLQFDGPGGAYFQGSALPENVDGGLGNDTIMGRGGSDTLVGGVGDDSLEGGAGADNLDAGPGADRVSGDGGDDIISGGADNDQVGGGDGNDVVQGGDGDDTLYIGGGRDTLTGGAGRDVFSIGSGVGLIVDFDPRFDSIGGWTSSSDVWTANVDGDGDGAVDDVRVASVGGSNWTLVLVNYDQFSIEGAAGDDSINGTPLNETIAGLEGNDRLVGGRGDDSLVGGAGDDVIEDGWGNDTLAGGLGRDSLYVAETTGREVIVGFDNTEDYLWASYGRNGIYRMNVDLDNDGQADDAIINEGAYNELKFIDIRMIALNGGSGNDNMRGTPLSDTIDGAAGEDTIAGVGGNDLLRGGFGNDSLLAGPGDSTLEGGDGNDTLAAHSGGNIRLVGGAGTDSYFLGEGRGATIVGFVANEDVLSVTTGWNGIANSFTGLDLDSDGQTDDARVETSFATVVFHNLSLIAVNGGAENDTLAGSWFADTLSGGNGNDTLRGSWGNDILSGQEGADQLWGEGGSDSLIGGDGNDLLRGGTGADLLEGGVGDDTLQSEEWDSDTLVGGEGRDVLSVGSSSHIVGYDSTQDTLLIGYDILSASLGPATGEDGIYASAQVITTRSNISHTISFSDVRLGLIGGGAGDDLLVGTPFADTILGGDGNDTIRDSFGANRIDAGAGNDSIRALSGSDTIQGGAGNDTIRSADWNVEAPGESGVIDGGAGSDSISVTWRKANIAGGAGDDTVSAGGTDAATINGGEGNDWITLSTLRGGWVAGGAGDDTISNSTSYTPAGWTNGGGSIYGELGNDSLVSVGNALLDGGVGDDTLVGRDNDTLSGGAGRDVFDLSGNFGGMIRITDFDAARDELRLANQLFQDPLSALVVGLDLDGDGASDDARVMNLGRMVELLNFDLALIQGVWTNDTLQGGIWPDLLIGTGANDVLNGLAGGDTLLGAGGADVLQGGSGNDALFGDAGDDTLNGEDGFDVLRGGSGNDRLVGGASAPFWATQFDQLFGDDGADTLIASPMGQLYGGDGADRLEGAGSLYGGDGADTLVGTVFLSSSYAGSVLDGGAGNDSVSFAFGNDTAFGGAGDDTIIFSTTTFGMTGGVVSAGSGNDSISLPGRPGWLDAGDGDDTVNLGPPFSAYIADLAAGWIGQRVSGGSISAVPFLNVENLGIFSGTIWGNEAANALSATGPFGGGDLHGLGGADTLRTGAGSDTLSGGAGDDLLDPVGSGGIKAETATDQVLGGDGWDTLSVRFATHAYTISLLSEVMTASNGVIGLGAGSSIVRFDDVEVIQLGSGSDIVVGWSGSVQRIEMGGGNDWFADYATAGNGGGTVNDQVFGEAGDDAAYGLAGDDLLDGGAGVDLLFGGDGADTLIGGAGGDWMGGGAGADVFRFLAASDSNAAQGYDAVGQFQTGIDRIDLAAIDANTGLAGDQAFTIGVLKAGVAGRLQITQASGYTLIAGDVDGDGIADIAFFVWSETSGVAAPATVAAGDLLL